MAILAPEGGGCVIAVGQDDSIFLAGDVGTRNFALLKYLPDGEGLDYTFNSTGIAQGPFSEAAAVAVEPSGRIIVAGVVASSTDEWAIASFQADGALGYSRPVLPAQFRPAAGAAGRDNR